MREDKHGQAVMSSATDRRCDGREAAGLHIVAKPVGAACNLDCAYCFYLEKQAREDMRMPDEGLGGTGVLKIDGKEAATQKMAHTLPFIMQWDENLDIGADTGSPVNDADDQPPFSFAGKLDKVTLTIDRPQRLSEVIKTLQEARRNNRVSE